MSLLFEYWLRSKIVLRQPKSTIKFQILSHAPTSRNLLNFSWIQQGSNQTLYGHPLEKIFFFGKKKTDTGTLISLSSKPAVKVVQMPSKPIYEETIQGFQTKSQHERNEKTVQVSMDHRCCNSKWWQTIVTGGPKSYILIQWRRVFNF